MIVKLISLILLALIGYINMSAQTLHDYSADVGNFVNLKVKGGIPLKYIFSTDSAGIVTFKADETTSQAIVFENKKGTLTVSLEPKLYNLDHKIPVVTVRSNHLNGVINEGDSTLIVESVNSTQKFEIKEVGKGFIAVKNIEAPDVKVTLRGGKGTVTVSGVCENAVLDNSGQGTIQAGFLKAGNVKCTLSGAGIIDCYARTSLNVKGVGTGTVYYAGSPADVQTHVIKLKVVDMEKTN